MMKINKDQIQIADCILNLQWFETFDESLQYELIDEQGFCCGLNYASKYEDAKILITWIEKEDDFGGTYMQCVTAAKVLNVTKDESYFQAQIK